MYDLWKILVKVCCIGAVICMFLPCVSTRIDGQDYYSSMFTTVWGIINIFTFVYVFILSFREHKIAGPVISILVGISAIMSFFTKKEQFVLSLEKMNLVAGKIYFQAGFYVGTVVIGTMIFVSILALIFYFSEQ